MVNVYIFKMSMKFCATQVGIISMLSNFTYFIYIYLYHNDSENFVGIMDRTCSNHLNLMGKYFLGIYLYPNTRQIIMQGTFFFMWAPLVAADISECLIVFK